MKKILIFPGAFNPPHLGHASSLSVVLKEKTFDEVWIIPSGNRDDKVISTSYEDRKNMGNLFVQFLKTVTSIPVKLITAELDDKENRKTVEILNEIKSTPDIEIIQLIGLDGILSLQENHAVSDNEKFIVVNRGGSKASQLRGNDNVLFVNEITENISSSQVRKMIKDGDFGYKKLLPENIADYIEKNGLYL